MESIPQIKLGNQGLVVPKIGLGCMGMTGMGHYDIYGKANEEEAIATIHRSLELGGNFLDTADLYGPLVNEQLIAKAIKGKRNHYIIATKFGWEIDDAGTITWSINGKKEYVKKAVERSLKNLNTDIIDLYYLHRVDPNTPIEETVHAMAGLVKAGKVKYLGLSEAGSETIRRAHAIHPITAVQSEYSLFERNVEEAGILITLQELGIGFVPYSPLGRGFSYAVHEALHLSEKEEEAVVSIIRLLHQELRNSIDHYSENVIIGYIELLLSYADRFYNRQFVTRKVVNHDLLVRVEEILTEYFNKGTGNKNGLPTVEYLAKQFNLSTGYFSDMLRSLTGLTAQQHIHEKMIEKAKEMLTATSMSVGEIAYHFGFEYPQSFNKLFKSKTNKTPLQYRQAFN